MAKAPKRQTKRRGRDIEEVQGIEPMGRKPRAKSAALKAEETWHRNKTLPLVCKNEAQERYLQTIKDNVITFGVGPAGTGKTHVSVKHAAQQMDAGDYRKIVILRPIVEMGKSLGALPGELEEKIEPWAEPFLKVLREHYGQHLEGKFSAGNIVFIPLQHIRGRTFDNAIVIVDEAQNTTPKEMKTLLTRTGINSKVILNGDTDQSDIPGESGLTDALNVLHGIAVDKRQAGKVGIATFVEEDIIRSDITRDVLIAYREHAKAKKKK